MKAPLAHYFLFTGHNSYLTGNQLSSNSSVHPIIQALLRGVRVIELDLWPNSKKNGVEVRHGGYGIWISFICGYLPYYFNIDISVLKSWYWSNPLYSLFQYLIMSNSLWTFSRTLTSSVDLVKCLRAIKDNAFTASEYPVIITFEDHLPADLQAKVAKVTTHT